MSTWIRLEGESSLPLLPRDLRHLELVGCEIDDLSPLIDLPHLSTISAQCCKLGDLKPLQQVHNLRRLELLLCDVTDATSLHHLRVRSLDLQGCPWDDDSWLHLVRLRHAIRIDDAEEWETCRMVYDLTGLVWTQLHGRYVLVRPGVARWGRGACDWVVGAERHEVLLLLARGVRNPEDLLQAAARSGGRMMSGDPMVPTRLSA